MNGFWDECDYYYCVDVDKEDDAGFDTGYYCYDYGDDDGGDKDDEDDLLNDKDDGDVTTTVGNTHLK